MSIDLQIEKTHSDICIQAAKQIAEQIITKPDSVIGLATGNTMEPIYAELVRMHKAEKLDFSQVKFFNLDEFKGIDAGDKRSFDYYLRTLFLDKINAQEKNIHLVQGKGFSPEDYENAIKGAGGIDIQLLGSGREGHIGFNEADGTSNADTRTREVNLADSTIEDTAATFGSIDGVPKQAYTQGIGTILDAKKIIMIINGGHKSRIARDMLVDGKIEELPARALLCHNDVSLYIDKPATELLADEQLKTYAKLDKTAIAEHRKHFAPIKIDMGDGTNVKLPYNVDIFLPEVMEKEEPFNPENQVHIKAFRKIMTATKASYAGAHQDDAELWVTHEIEKHIDEKARGNNGHFLNIVMTDGAAYVSALKRHDEFSKMTPEELVKTRNQEQRDVCKKYGYPAIMLGYPSKAAQNHVTDEKQQEIVDVMQSLYEAMPNHERSYHHHPEDNHNTHIACANISVQALRNSKVKPEKSYSLPAWGKNSFTDEVFGLKNPDLIGDLLNFFESQIKMQERSYHTRGIANAMSTFDSHLKEGDGGKSGALKGLNITECIRNNIPLIDAAQQAAQKHYDTQKAKGGKLAVAGSPEAGGHVAKTNKSGGGWATKCL